MLQLQPVAASTLIAINISLNFVKSVARTAHCFYFSCNIAICSFTTYCTYYLVQKMEIRKPQITIRTLVPARTVHAFAPQNLRLSDSPWRGSRLCWSSSCVSAMSDKKDGSPRLADHRFVTLFNLFNLFSRAFSRNVIVDMRIIGVMDWWLRQRTGSCPSQSRCSTRPSSITMSSSSHSRSSSRRWSSPLSS